MVNMFKVYLSPSDNEFRMGSRFVRHIVYPAEYCPEKKARWL